MTIIAENLVLTNDLRLGWYWGRPSTSELHADLRDVTRKCRWDFDLGNPEVRAAWQRGEKDRFSPLRQILQADVRAHGG